MNPWRTWFPTPRAYGAGIAIGALATTSMVAPFMMYVAYVLTAALLLMVMVETLLLYRRGALVDARRLMDERLWLGEENIVEIIVASSYPWMVDATVIDELPDQIQNRTFNLETNIAASEPRSIRYTIRPVERCEYEFGSINIFVSRGLKLIQRKWSCGEPQTIAVHASVMELRRAEMKAFTFKSGHKGTHRIRRLGHTMEFEKIKPYVRGDDIRSLNWKATARSGDVMVNLFQDEREQDVYSVLDLGRVMYSPFNGMTSLDYAVNATLAFSNVVLRKHDNAGLITFGSKPGTVVSAKHKPNQLGVINNALYNVQTEFEESNDEHLITMARRFISRRSLIMLYTNFDAMVSLKRRMPALRLLAKRHVLVVVMFENTDLAGLLNEEASDHDDIVRQAVARDSVDAKLDMVRELKHYGIHGTIARPEQLSTASINAYLDLKARGVI